MQTFKDRAGREWNVVITVGDIKRVNSALNIDLADLQTVDATGKSLLARLESIVLVADVVWHLIKPQADVLGIKQETFDIGVDGSCVNNMSNAFWGEYSNFFQSLSPIASIVRGALAITSGEKSTSSPESLESTQTPTATDN